MIGTKTNAEKETSLSGLPDNKQIRVVQNNRILNIRLCSGKPIQK